MKNLIRTLPIGLLLILSVPALAASMSPSTYSDAPSQVYTFGSCPEYSNTNRYYVWAYKGDTRMNSAFTDTSGVCGHSGTLDALGLANGSLSGYQGVIHVLIIDSNYVGGGSCSFGNTNYDDCTNDPDGYNQYLVKENYTVTYSAPSGGGGGGGGSGGGGDSGGSGGDSDLSFGSLLAAADSGMATTTGFNISSVVQWSGDNLIKLFIGSGLAVLYGLRWWIAALVLIGTIIYFCYRVLRQSRGLAP